MYYRIKDLIYQLNSYKIRDQMSVYTPKLRIDSILRVLAIAKAMHVSTWYT